MSNASENSQNIILIVDDNTDALGNFKEILEGAGYQIHTAVSCIDAQKLIDKVKYDVALVDLKMPGFEGVTHPTAGENLKDYIIKNSEYTSVIILTAVPSVDSVKRSLRSGVFDYLDKRHATADDILDAVQKAVAFKSERIVKLRNMQYPPSGS